jgi:tetratricopeptide (TPR) repeat protein
MASDSGQVQDDFTGRIDTAVSRHYAGKSEVALNELDALLAEATDRGLDDFTPTLHAQRAMLLRSLQYFDRAIEASEQACRGFRRLGNLDEVIKQLLMMASIWSRLGESETALQLSTEACELAELSGNKRLRASAESTRGIALGRCGRYREEAQAARLALNVMLDLRDRRGAAVASLNLGACYSNLGQFEDALPLLLDARKTLLELGYLMPSFAAANGLIEVYVYSGRASEARAVLSELKAVQTASEQTPNSGDSPGTEEQEAQVLAAEGEFDQAADVASSGAVILEERDMRSSAARLRALAADFHLKAGRPAKARDSAQAAHDLLMSCGHGGAQELLRVLIPWAEAEFALGNLQLASNLLKDAQAELKRAPESYLVSSVCVPRVFRLRAALPTRVPTLEDA